VSGALTGMALVVWALQHNEYLSARIRYRFIPGVW
jgi:hypothetical protein